MIILLAFTMYHTIDRVRTKQTKNMQAHGQVLEVNHVADDQDWMLDAVDKLANKLVGRAMKPRPLHCMDLDNTNLVKPQKLHASPDHFPLNIPLPKLRPLLKITLPRRPRPFLKNALLRPKPLLKVSPPEAPKAAEVIAVDELQEVRAAAAALAKEARAWSSERIDKRISVRNTTTKGRCLFINEDCKPGQVVFVEKPIFIVKPSLAPKLWEALTKVHEHRSFLLGTITFHFAALLSLFNLDQPTLQILLDKFAPDNDEESKSDVMRILSELSEELKEYQEAAIDPHTLQRLVSVWRYNSFANNGIHEEEGLIMYNHLSTLAHSCDPSCCWVIGDDGAILLRARISLSKDDELTHSYLPDKDLLKGTSIRQQKLENWGFACACDRCALRTDIGRGFRCPQCRIGICYVLTRPSGNTLAPCSICAASPMPEETSTLFQLEEEHVNRLANLNEADVANVDSAYQSAIGIFDRHWILYDMDTILWEAYKETNMLAATEHLRRSIEFHEHYYSRPTQSLAWCYRQLGDALQAQSQYQAWQHIQAFQKSCQLVDIVFGEHYKYALSSSEVSDS